jgi:hypothetical protein
VLRCDLNAHLPDNWVENQPRFTAVRFDINGVKSVVVSMPGEPLLELGWWVRNDTAAMGFDTTFLAGYSNAHMGYFATPNEYDIGTCGWAWADDSTDARSRRVRVAADLLGHQHGLHGAQRRLQRRQARRALSRLVMCFCKFLSRSIHRKKRRKKCLCEHDRCPVTKETQSSPL